MEKLNSDIASLEKIFTNLNNSKPENVTETKFLTCDTEHEFLISFIPSKTYHPLRRIVGKVSTSFLVVGKSLQADCNDSTKSAGDITPQVARLKNERVPVGKPLSQEVFYLTGSEPLQSYAGVSKYNIHDSRGCTTEWFLSVENVHPCSLEAARYFLSVYANTLRGSLRPTEVWICVDGTCKNPQGIIYLGMIPENGTVGRKTVRHVICTSKNEPITNREDLPELSSFLHHHLSSSLSTTFVETHGYALYEVMGASNFSAQDGENSRITVELTWSGVSSLLQSHPHSCDGVLHVRNIPGSVHLATHSLYLELVRVDAFFKILVEEDYPWPPLAAVSEKTVVSQMDGFFTKLNSSNVFPPVVDDEESKEDANDCTFAEGSMAHLTFQEFARKDLDFTERLWLLLKDCVDEDDLAGSLQMCCMALFNNKCQPVVHSSNMTSLAVFIRDLLQFETKEQLEKLQTRAKKFLSPDSAIKCLVEIGCEKLARDYSQYFIQQELATMGQLANYLDNNAPLGTRVSHIIKLHQILELVVTAKSVTRLGHENMRSLTQSALMYYQTHTDSDNQHPTFSLSLPAFGSTSGAAVKSICSSSNPAVWCVSFRSKTKTGDHTTMVQLSTSHPGRGISASPGYNVTELNDEDFDSDKEKFQYFLTCAKQVTMPVV